MGEGARDKAEGGERRAILNGGGAVDADLVRSVAAEGEDEDDVVVTFRLTRDLNKRLDKYLQDRIAFMSRTQLQRLIREQAVTVNGRAAKASTALRLGDEVRVMVPPPPAKEIPAEEMALSILHEDDDLIVLNKQPDVIVHPARGNKTGTIINGLAWHLEHVSSGSLSSVGAEQARPGVVHRLDRFTTGALVAAKTDTAHWRLGKQFEARTTDKRYLAVVVGRVEPEADVIEAPIGKHPTIRELQAVRYDETGKPATTIYRVREQFEGYAVVELELKTGRTHQIRVHLSHLGWPIAGDDLYGGPAAITLGEIVGGRVAEGEEAGEIVIARQALHASTIAFRHPSTGEQVSYRAPAWPDFARLVDVLVRYRRLGGPMRIPGATVDLSLDWPAHYQPES